MKSRRWMRRRAQSVGLVAFGALVGAGSFVVLEQGSSSSARATSLVFYASCREAIQAGTAPMRRSDPGYRLELDADGDGIACEPYRPR